MGDGFGGMPRPPGGRAGSENNTLLPLTMTGLNFGTLRLGIQKLYRPETLTVEKKNKF